MITLKKSLLALIFAALFLPCATARAGVAVNYLDGSTALRGYLAGADLPGRRPGVLIVHQWMGLTDYEKGRADQIAKELGYVAFAADIYGVGNAPKNTKEAGKLSGAFEADRKLYDRRVLVALDQLKSQPNVDPRRIAVIGYCFGGAGALDMARINAPVVGVVTFHGFLTTNAPATGPIRPRILILHGADDPYVNHAAVLAVERELDAVHARYHVVLYKGAVHAFTQPSSGDDPSKGVAYNAKADHESWKAMSKFLAEIFK
ncbi:MAG: dienelactone hydrolase family protein [bacterium]